MLAFNSASAVGWLGTRLTIRPLTLSEQLVTGSVLVLTTLYAWAIVYPLFRLGKWSGSRTKSAELEGLEHIFS